MKIKVNQKSNSRDLIVGELLGRVDPNDLLDLINSKFYPIVNVNSNIKLEMVSYSPQKIIFNIHYPNNISDSHPERVVLKFYESEQ